MKIVIVAPFMSDSNYRRVQSSFHMSTPGQKFYSLLYKGLVHKGIEVRPFSIVNQDFEPFLLDDEFVYNFKPVHGFGKGRLKTVANALSRLIDNDTVIIADGEAYWTLVVSLKQKCKVINLITDFPHHVASYSSSMSTKSYLYKRIYQVYARHKLKAFKKADGYILLTEQMTDVVGHKKPYVVIEGVTDSDYRAQKHFIDYYHAKPIISYLGALNDKSGILRLVEAMRKIDFPWTLQIYGSGKYAEELQKLCDERIVYKGTISLDEVTKVEVDSDFLINPRPSGDEYNKYSFPSKTLEYMLSGTPVISTRLAGIPQEYENYIFYIDDSSVEIMAESIRSILTMDSSVLNQKATEAQLFAKEKKNNIVQAERIIDFIEDNYLYMKK